MKAEKIIFALFFTFLPFFSFSQLCTGSLGDPVWKEDFGSGTTQGSALGPAITDYTFKPADCPNDGEYTIENSINNCYGSSWHNLTEDHTSGDRNGYMMVVNSSYDPGIFYRKVIQGLCPNTTYEFGAWVLNLYKKNVGIDPNITFIIETTDGHELNSYNTNDISATATPQWKQFGLQFRTLPDISDVVLIMKNNAPGGTGNDLVIDDITFRPCGPALDPVISQTGSSGTHICEGAAMSLDLKTTDVSTFYSNPRYLWQQSNNGTNWTDIPGTDAAHAGYTASFTNASPGAYYYRMMVGEATNNLTCYTASEPILITVDPAPVIPEITPPVCEGNTLQLDLEAAGTFSWTGPNGWTSTEQKPSIPDIQTNQAGTYQVIINNGLCSESRTTQVNVNPLPVADAGMDVNICEGESTVLNATGGTNYQWSPATGLSDPNIQNPVANPSDTSTYTVLVTNAGGCQRSDQVTINVAQKITANAGEDQVTVQGKPVHLSGSVNKGSNYHIVWEPSDHLDDPNSLTPTAMPTEDITYTLRAVSDDNCSTDEDQVFIRVYQSLQIPNAFSPNGDGINDTWNIIALNTYPNSVLTVYNRYGNVVFRSTGYPVAWNGKSKGKDLPGGTYYYTIDLKEEGKDILKGWIMIVR